jgi:hypothetical protein
VCKRRLSARTALCGEDWRRERNELRQFPQILGSGGQKELVFRSARAAQAQSIEPEDALQMSEEHLDLLSLAARDGVGLGPCDRTGPVASGFMNGARDLACRNFGQHLGLSAQASQSCLRAK